MDLHGKVAEAAIAALIGEVISERGQTRIIYALDGDDDWVIKEGRSAPYAANATEWEVWSELQGSEMADLFAECRAVSTSYRYLIMRRLKPDIGSAPKPSLPAWLTDRKVSGLGLASDGSIKVVDYGAAGGVPGERADAPLNPWPNLGLIDEMAKWRAILDENGDASA